MLFRSVGDSECLSPIRIEYHLGDTLAVAQIDKNNTTMIPAAVDPATELNVLID